MQGINDHGDTRSPENELQPKNDTVPDGYSDDSRDRAEFEQWKREGRPTTMIDASAASRPHKSQVTNDSARTAGKTSRNDVTVLHDKLCVVLRTAGIAWPKDSETSFHTLTEDDYDEDGIGEEQPLHAGELPES